MKHTWTIVLSLLLAMFFLITTAAYATESIVFVDDDPSNFTGVTTYIGTWIESNFVPQSYGQGYRFSTTFGGQLRMRTTIDIDESGGGADNVSGSQFQAFARWSAGANRCSSVRVEVRNFTTNALVTSQNVNQQILTHQLNWNPIGGRFTAVPGHLYEIRFYSSGGCVTTADGGMFVQQTYDSSDVYNLTALSTIDEGGIDYTTQSTLSFTSLNTCFSYGTIKSLTLTVPDSVTTRYVSCRATGRGSFSVTGKYVLFLIEDSSSTTTWDQFTYTGAATTSNYGSYDDFAMQKVYTVGTEGGSFSFYLKACRQDTATTGTVYMDDLVCDVLPTRY